ncbi:MAG: ABC transporter permease [Actinomycetota bacterium]|nr:MAG: ABC transporter permease [Actinomycetota bacterium]
MNALIRAEWLKITTTRMVVGMTITALLLTAFAVVVTILTVGLEGVPPLTNPATIRNVFASGVGGGSIIVLILGILGMTGEIRHQTITSTFLAAPRRGRVVGAKMTSYALVGAIIALLCSALTIVLALALLPLKEHLPIPWGEVGQIVGGAVLCYAIYAILGVAVGSLVRNQVAAIIGTIAWVLVAEQLLIGLLPAVGKWLPGGAAAGVLQASPDVSVTLLPVWLGALVLLGYGVVLGLLAARTTLRADVT